MLRDEILTIKKKAIKKAEDELEEIYQEHKKTLGIFLLLLMDYFEKYSLDDKLSVNTYQRISILKDLEQRIIKEMKPLGYKEVEFSKNVLEAIIIDSFEGHINAIGGGKKIFLNPLSIKDIIFKEYKGNSFDNRIFNNKRNLAGKLYVELDKALLQNATLDEVARNIKEIFKMANYESYRLLMNEQSRVFDLVQIKAFIETSAIEKIMWVSALCENTCPYCEMMDGSVFEVNDPDRPEIPAHVLCQCCWIPV